MTQAWGRIVDILKYTGLKDKRTIRQWMRDGLPISRLPSGTVLIKFEDVDTFLKKYSKNQNNVDVMVNQLLKGL